MARPWQDLGGRRLPSVPPDMRSDIYAGPEEFMEVGSRGFLVTTTPGNEEFALDNAIELLRQASIKLYGGTKLPMNRRAKDKKLDLEQGSVRMDFMDPQALTTLPCPDEEEEEGEEDGDKEADGGDKKIDEYANDDDAENNKEEEERKKETDDKSEDEKKKPHETEAKIDEDKTNEAEAEAKVEQDKPEESGQIEENAEETGEKIQEIKKNEEDETKTEKKDGENATSGDEKTVSGEEKTDSQAGGEEKNDKKTSPKKEPVLRMRSLYKFKAFRTEMRNVMFIKSDVPEPIKVVEAAMEIVLQRKTMPSDAVCQLLPVLGVCPYNNFQLEVMTRRVLAPIFEEGPEPKSFSVLLVDKLSEVGSELLVETVRNAIWCVNPTAWQASPTTEPDVVIRLELLGSKLVMCCLPNFMKYRHYSPNMLLQLGLGEAEDDDGTWTSGELRKQQEMHKAHKEKMKEQARQREDMARKREEERRKEREKRRTEAEAQRKEANKRRNREDGKKANTKEDVKETEKDKQHTEVKNDKEEKSEEGKSKEEVTVPEEKEKESETDKEDEGNKEKKNCESKETPPRKKQRLESSEVEEEAEKEDGGEESEEGEGEEADKEDKKTTPTKRRYRGKRAGRRKSKK